MPEQPPLTPVAAGPTDPQAGIAELHGAAERLWVELSPRWPGLNLDVLPSTPSTSTVARDMAPLGIDGPCVVVAWQQTAGRGRHGRTWDAQPGHTLTVSLALPLPLGRIPGGGGTLSLAVGLWVAQALDALRPDATPIGLKWPNDLWVADRKLGGILIEATPRPDGQHWVVIGLGLNLQGTPAELSPQRCDLAGLGCPLTPAQALSVVVPALLAGLDAYPHDGFHPWLAAWQRRDVLAGRRVARHATGAQGPQGDALQTGTACGIDADGALRVEVALEGSGPQVTTVEKWVSGEVSVRPLS